jgi:UDP-N-acetylglucosamine 2-epimerase (non-hydrolysing)
MTKIAVLFGTRPEFIKCKPLLTNSNELKAIYVEQHVELFDETFTTSVYKRICIENSSTCRLTNIVTSVLNSGIFDERWDAVMVQGDTAVAFAGALAAFHRSIPVIHLEAGLRTFDIQNPWPEESYRKSIDSMTSLAFCPTDVSMNNLRKEGYSGIAHIVGNTSIDVISSYNLKTHLGNKVLVTLHRRENWNVISEFFAVIEELAHTHPDLEFILPIHPNPAIRKNAESIFKKVKVIEPLPHKELCELMASCNCIISDSGGIQEEASYLGKRVFCCRKVTERCEVLGSHVILTPTALELKTHFEKQTDSLEKSCIYGNGKTYLKVLEVIKSIYGINNSDR